MFIVLYFLTYMVLLAAGPFSSTEIIYLLILNFVYGQSKQASLKKTCGLSRCVVNSLKCHVLSWCLIVGQGRSLRS